MQSLHWPAAGLPYVYLLLEAMQRAGEALQLTPDVAHAMTVQTATAAAAIAAGGDHCTSYARASHRPAARQRQQLNTWNRTTCRTGRRSYRNSFCSRTIACTSRHEEH